jgi:hypothetical protein
MKFAIVNSRFRQDIRALQGTGYFQPSDCLCVIKLLLEQEKIME